MPGRFHRRLCAILLFAMLLPLPAAATEPVGPELTPRLHDLLRAEMQEVDTAMGRLFTALVTGEHARVAEQATRIHETFILKQRLTAEDRRALKRATPKAFRELDRTFHARAAALAEAARAGDTERQWNRYRAMGQACITCHSRYATDRFPGLAR